MSWKLRVKGYEIHQILYHRYWARGKSRTLLMCRCGGVNKKNTKYTERYKISYHLFWAIQRLLIYICVAVNKQSSPTKASSRLWTLRVRKVQISTILLNNGIFRVKIWVDFLFFIKIFTFGYQIYQKVQHVTLLFRANGNS